MSERIIVQQTGENIGRRYIETLPADYAKRQLAFARDRQHNPEPLPAGHVIFDKPAAYGCSYPVDELPLFGGAGVVVEMVCVVCTDCGERGNIPLDEHSMTCARCGGLNVPVEWKEADDAS